MNGSRDDEDDEYFAKAIALGERLSGADPDESVRRIAREEAEARVQAYLRPILFLAAMWWANSQWGRQGASVVVAAGVVWFVWSLGRTDHDPKHDRHLVLLSAEDLIRLEVVAEAHEAGETVWVVSDKEYSSDTRKIAAKDGPRWDGWWKRVYYAALDLERLSPKGRRKRLMSAALRAKAALLQGKEMAGRENAELSFWARNYVQKLGGN